MLRLCALLCLTLMTGNELCVLAFVNPVLRHASEEQQVPFRSGTAKLLGRVMPFWYAASLLLTAAAAWQAYHDSGMWQSSPSLSVLLQLVVLVLTLSLMVPVNNKLAALRTGDTGWTPLADRWDRLHLLRVALLCAAVLALAV